MTELPHLNSLLLMGNILNILLSPTAVDFWSMELHGRERIVQDTLRM